MKEAEYFTGPQAQQQFANALQKALSIPRSEMQRRLEAERVAAALKPARRGPKPKKPASPHSYPESRQPTFAAARQAFRCGMFWPCDQTRS